MNSGRGSDDNIYLVEKIVGRRVRRGQAEYLVRWKGYSSEYDSWEPFAHIQNVNSSLLNFSGPGRAPFVKDFRNQIPNQLFEQSDSNNNSHLSNTRIIRRIPLSSNQPSTSFPNTTVIAQMSDVTISPRSGHSSKGNNERTSNTSNISTNRSVPVLSRMRRSTSESIPLATTSAASQSSAPHKVMIKLEECDKNGTSFTPSEPNRKRPRPSVLPEKSPISEFDATKLGNQRSMSTSSGQNSACGSASHRKSVTIMLKTHPTEEFHSATSIKNQTPMPPHRVPPAGPEKKTSVTAGHKPSSKQITPSQKVLNVINYLKDKRRRPEEVAVVQFANKMYGMNLETTKSILKVLVKQGSIHCVNCNSGVSYRFQTGVLARGDTPRQVAVTNKIKARYASQTASSAKVHANTITSKKDRPKKKARNRSSKPLSSETVPPNSLSPAQPLLSTSEKAINVEFSTLKSFLHLLMQGQTPKPLGSELSLEPVTLLKKIRALMPQEALNDPPISKPGVSVYVLPPASPLDLDTIKRSLNSLPHKSSNVSIDCQLNGDGESGSLCHSTPAGSISGTPTEMRPSSNLRSTIRQETLVFSSIIVNRELDKSFTEICLRSPGSVTRNCFTLQVLSELTAALNQAISDPVRLVVISGVGRVFSSGIDLSTLTTSETTQEAIDNNTDYAGCLSTALSKFLLALLHFPKLLIAGVNGPALGLGTSVLPLFDLVYASDCATFHLPYTLLGQTPEAGASFTLANLVGLPLANDLLLASRRLSAREALQRGLVSDIIFPKNFKQELLMRCQRLAVSSAMAMETSKCLIRMQHRERVEFVIETECRKLAEVWRTPEFQWNANLYLRQRMDDYV